MGKRTSQILRAAKPGGCKRYLGRQRILRSAGTRVRERTTIAAGDAAAGTSGAGQSPGQCRERTVQASGYGALPAALLSLSRSGPGAAHVRAVLSDHPARPAGEFRGISNGSRRLLLFVAIVLASAFIPVLPCPGCSANTVPAGSGDWPVSAVPIASRQG